MSIRPFIFAPHYLFGDEHLAHCVFSFLEHDVQALPIDVSKGHLCISIGEDETPPPIGFKLENIEIELLKRKFILPCLTVRTVRKEPYCATEIELSSESCEDSNAVLWEISYLLRSMPALDSETVYTDRTLPKVPARGLYTEEARQERLAFVRQETKAPLADIEKIHLDPRKLVSNIEALIGSVEIPVGVAGPLHIKGTHAGGLFYAPFATSEGALVASATRGATALSRSGGVTTRVLGQRMMRVPVFVFEDMSNALFFAEWIKDHYRDLADEVNKYSNYATLEEVTPHVMGRSVHVHFVYETGDAAGQNMTTTCTWQACKWVMKQIRRFEGLRIENFLIEANLSNDKKVTYQTFLKGRGVRVMAEVLLTEDTCEKILKVTPKQLASAYQHIVMGSISAGMIGININVANVIGAMFTALGQDIACVHESSLAQLHMELTDDNNVYCTLMLPSLVIGTVGGGTNLPQQRECLEMIGCAGPNKAHKLAEVIAGFCLALDISTLSAVAADHFARAHEKLGRNRPVNYLKMGDLNTDFFNTALSKTNPDCPLVLEVEALTLNSKGSSIITELTSHKINKLIGHFPFILHDQHGEKINVITKVKPLDEEVILMVNSMAAMCNPRLAQAFNTFRHQLDFKGCHIRELGVMSQQDPRFTRHAPKVYGVLADPEREAYVIIEEHLQNVELMDSADDTFNWNREHIEAAIRGIAEVHSIWYGREEELKQQPWLVSHPTAASMTEKLRLWELLGVHAREEFPEWFSEEDLANYRDIVHQLSNWWAIIEAMPRTLIHNDFNPRNITFRRDANTGELCLCAYDWELATLQLPQHDLAELLGSTLYDPIMPEDVHYYVELHRTELEKHSGKAIDPVQWHYGYVLSLMDLTVNRLPMYMMAHTFRHYAFMERVYRAFRNLLEIEGVGKKS
jgi:NADP-dependent 3-hydroxy-3-methylglutaryl-CoA reductase